MYVLALPELLSMPRTQRSIIKNNPVPNNCIACCRLIALTVQALFSWLSLCLDSELVYLYLLLYYCLASIDSQKPMKSTRINKSITFNFFYCVKTILSSGIAFQVSCFMIHTRRICWFCRFNGDQTVISLIYILYRQVYCHAEFINFFFAYLNTKVEIWHEYRYLSFVTGTFFKPERHFPYLYNVNLDSPYFENIKCIIFLWIIQFTKKADLMLESMLRRH